MMMLMLSASLRMKMAIRRSMSVVPKIGTIGLGYCTPSCANLEPSPAAIMPYFIGLSLFFIFVLKIQPVAVVAFLEVELAEGVTACIVVLLAVAIDVDACIYCLTE